jgi:predicted nucleic acid-binding protein
MKTICLDSSGWIEIALDGPNAKKFAKALSAPMVVSVINIFEISKYITRETGADAAQEMLSFIQQYPVIDVTAELAASAADISLRYKLAMADSLIYATALTQNATLWTQDDDFKDLPSVRFFPKITS